MKVKASFVIAARNCQAYISQAIHSCLSQDGNKFEVIAVNDGSTDGTGRVMDYLADQFKNLKVVHLQENSGRSVARNRGIEASCGEIILIQSLFCSSDQ